MRLGWLLIVLSVALVGAATATPALAQTDVVDRPAEIRAGTCASLGEMVVSLAHLVLTLGEPQGQLEATPVEQSGTVVPYDVVDFLAENHSVVVLESPAESAPLVACGEIGGALNPDGTLAIGMRSMNGSGLSGIAYFTPIDQFQNTLVTILLVQDTGETTTVVEEVTTDEGAAPA